MNEVTTMVKKIGKIIAAVILCSVLFGILCNVRRSDGVNLIAFIVSIICTVLLFKDDYNNKLLAVLIAVVTFAATKLNNFATIITAVVSVAVYIYFKKNTTDDCFSTRNAQILMNDEWMDHNRLALFRIETYSYIPKGYLTVKKGIFSTHTTHLFDKNIQNYIIDEERTVLQKILGLSSVSFTPWVEPGAKKEKEDINRQKKFYVRNIPRESAETLILLVNS